MDRALPGFTPDFVRLSIAHRDDGYYDLFVILSEDRRYISGADEVHYGPLCAEELLDVMAAIMDALSL